MSALQSVSQSSASTTRAVMNFVGFQISWFALVLGAANGLWFAGLGIAAGWLVVHLLVAEQSRVVDLRLALVAATVGFASDSSLVLAGLIEFPTASAVGPLSPPWMVGLWVAFSLTLGHSLGWLRGRYLLAAAAGAGCGPAAYLAGQALGAIELPLGPYSLLGVGLAYALATPLLLAVRAKLDEGSVGTATRVSRART